jgi:hypothetical protein
MIAEVDFEEAWEAVGVGKKEFCAAVNRLSDAGTLVVTIDNLKVGWVLRMVLPRK